MPPTATNTRKPPPGRRELESTLGKAGAHWAQLYGALSDAFGPLVEKWTYSGTTQRWSLQLKQRKRDRTVLYMIPCRGHFLAAFALGERACEAAREAGMPAAVLELIDGATCYPEGRGVRLEVRSRKDAETVARLATIKMAH